MYVPATSATNERYADIEVPVSVVLVHTDESDVGDRPFAAVADVRSVFATEVTYPVELAVANRFAAEPFPIAFAVTVLCADPAGAEITFAATVTVSPETLAAASSQ